MKLLRIIVPTGLLLALLLTGCQPAEETIVVPPIEETTTTPSETTIPTIVPTENTTPPKTTPVEGIRKGNLAPDFQLQSLDGNTVSLSGLRGKPVLLNFWATWCPPCRKEMPYLQQIYNDWTSKGLVLLEIDVGETPATVNEFMKNNNLSMPVLLDVQKEVTRKYGIGAIPTTFFIDIDGIIQERVEGAFPNKLAIEPYIIDILP
ncbi:MAG: redoxin domain-containing protein [Chloroflexota bacterium]